MHRHALITCAALALLIGAPAHAGQYSCSNGATLRPNNTCSDGSIAIYKAEEVKPYAAAPVKPRRAEPVRPQGSQAIEPYHAREVKPFTQEERRRMRENDDRAAKELARKLSPNGKLNQQQIDALANQRCLQAAAVNPDVRCVPR